MCYFRSADYSRINQTSELKSKYFRLANENTLVIANIEGLTGVKNIDKILDEDVIDVIFIGPYDLSQSLGIPGQVNNKKVTNEMEKIINKAKEKNKIIGTFVDNTEAAKKWIDLGVKFIAYLVDMGIMFNACNRILDDIR